jgi:hypothetical protein
MGGGHTVYDTQASQKQHGAAVAELQAAFADLTEQMEHLRHSSDYSSRAARCHVRI